MSTLYPVAQAATLIGISRATLYREHAEGKIRITKVRGSSFVSDAEIERYIAAAVERRPRRSA